MNERIGAGVRFAALASILVSGCDTGPSTLASPRGGGTTATTPASALAALEQPAAMTVDVAQFRGGPARTGRMVGPAPSRTPELRWTYVAGGPVRTAPAIGFGLVFIGSDDGTLQAIDEATGALVWRTDLGREPTSPAIAGEVVIDGSVSGHVLAVDARTGRPTWDVDLGAPVRGAPAVVDEGIVIAVSDGTVVLLDPSSGARRWTSVLDGRITRSPAVADGRVVVPLDPGAVAAVDLGTGSLDWTTRIVERGGVGSPATDAGIVVTGLGLGGGLEGDHGVAGLDLGSGEIRWRYRSPVGREVLTPALFDGRAFAIGLDGIVLAIDAVTGKPVWTRQLDEALEALPAISGGLLVIAGNNGHLRALDIADGTDRWSVPIEGVPYAPSVAQGIVIVPTDTGTVYAFGAPQ